MEKAKELLKKLDELMHGRVWEEISYEYEDCGHEFETDWDQILQEFGFDRYAYFIYRVHTVDYGPRGCDFWKKAYIVREAILSPDFDMDGYLKKHHPDIGESHLHQTSHGSQGSKTMFC